MIAIRLALPLAITATGTAVCMSLLCGWQRGGTLAERVVWLALSVVLVVCAHLLPALVRSEPVIIQLMGAVLWGACMVTTGYNYGCFFLFAQQHAGNTRASAVATDVKIPSESSQTLAPVMEERATIARELAQAKALRCARHCDGLEVRRITLAAKLDALEAQADDIRRQEVARDRITAQRDALVTDPLTARLAALLGVGTARVDLVTASVFAAVLEGVSCLLWLVALRPPPLLPAAAVTPQAVTRVTADRREDAGSHRVTSDVSAAPETDDVPPDEVTQLVRDIAAGRLRPTVTGIRRHLGCSQARASALRRQLVNPQS
jgi:hypothetical protein